MATLDKKISAQIAENIKQIKSLKNDLAKYNRLLMKWRKGEIDWDTFRTRTYEAGIDGSSVEHRIGFLREWNGALKGSIKYISEYLYSDVNAYEIIEIKTPRTFVIREMKATEKAEAKKERMDSFVPGGFVGHFDNDKQEWDITSDPNGAVIAVSVRKCGNGYRMAQVGHSLSTIGWGFHKEPYYYYDFNF